MCWEADPMGGVRRDTLHEGSLQRSRVGGDNHTARPSGLLHSPREVMVVAVIYICIYMCAAGGGSEV